MYNLVSSTELIMRLATVKRFETELTFRAVGLRRSSDESLYGGQFTLSTQLIEPNYIFILPTDAATQFL